IDGLDLDFSHGAIQVRVRRLSKLLEQPLSLALTLPVPAGEVPWDKELRRALTGQLVHFGPLFKVKLANLQQRTDWAATLSCGGIELPLLLKEGPGGPELSPFEPAFSQGLSRLLDPTLKDLGGLFPQA